MRRKTETDDEVKVVRGLKASHKLILAVVGIVTTLYFGISIVVDVRFDRAIKNYEKSVRRAQASAEEERRKQVQQELDRLDRRVEKTDDRVRELERFHRNDR